MTIGTSQSTNENYITTVETTQDKTTQTVQTTENKEIAEITKTNKILKYKLRKQIELANKLRK